MLIPDLGNPNMIEYFHYLNPTKKELYQKYSNLIKSYVFLKRLKIIHNDTKPENLVFTIEGVIKIIDYGVSDYAFDSERNIEGTQYLFSPHKQIAYKSSMKGTNKYVSD